MRWRAESIVNEHLASDVLQLRSLVDALTAVSVVFYLSVCDLFFLLSYCSVKFLTQQWPTSSCIVIGLKKFELTVVYRNN